MSDLKMIRYIKKWFRCGQDVDLQCRYNEMWP